MFNMSNLFEKYRSAGNDEAALMVANNEFNKAPGDKAAFEQYFSFVCSLGTSLPSLLDRQAALEAGMDGHIAKPVSVQALELAIARLLSRRSGDTDTDPDSKEAPEQ